MKPHFQYSPLMLYSYHPGADSSYLKHFGSRYNEKWFRRHFYLMKFYPYLELVSISAYIHAREAFEIEKEQPYQSKINTYKVISDANKH